MVEARPYEDRRRREVEALRRIGHLSRRERQVLALLSGGLANKEIAQRLDRDPATTLYHVRKLVDTGFLVALPVRRGVRGASSSFFCSFSWFPRPVSNR